VGGGRGAAERGGLGLVPGVGARGSFGDRAAASEWERISSDFRVERDCEWGTNGTREHTDPPRHRVLGACAAHQLAGASYGHPSLGTSVSLLAEPGAAVTCRVNRRSCRANDDTEPVIRLYCGGSSFQWSNYPARYSYRSLVFRIRFTVSLTHWRSHTEANLGSGSPVFVYF
jgi:hypothetical protein